jgi:glycosyltransferase involved in cell wall biosynthesis
MGADLGIVPKKDGVFVGEAISTKLFQYTAVGLPAVVSRTVAEQRYFNEDEVKFFNPGNPEDMARCIQELYENPQSRLDMAQRALKKRDVYSLSANTPKYVRIIDDLITRNRR